MTALTVPVITAEFVQSMSGVPSGLASISLTKSLMWQAVKGQQGPPHSSHLPLLYVRLCLESEKTSIVSTTPAVCRSLFWKCMVPVCIVGAGALANWLLEALCLHSGSVSEHGAWARLAGSLRGFAVIVSSRGRRRTAHDLASQFVASVKHHVLFGVIALTHLD